MGKRWISTNILCMKDSLWRVFTVTNFEKLRYYFDTMGQYCDCRKYFSLCEIPKSEYWRMRFLLIQFYCDKLKKSKFRPITCHGSTVGEGEVKVQLYSFCNLGDRWWCAVDATPRSVYPPEGDPVAYPLYRGLSGPQSRVERVRKMSLPPGFDSPDRLVHGE
jgi:hypothetical protein